LFGASAHRLFSFPSGGHYAPAGSLVGQQRQADTPVDLLKSWHDGIANVRNSGVDGRWLRLDGGRARVHDPPLSSSGQRPGGATGSTNTFLRRIGGGNS
jgi:hypothetical protein